MRPLFGRFTNLTCTVYCLDLQIQTSSSLFGVKWILIGIPVSRSSATTSSVWNLDSNIRNITISFESCLLTRRTNICAAVRSLTNQDTLISQKLSNLSKPRIYVGGQALSLFGYFTLWSALLSHGQDMLPLIWIRKAHRCGQDNIYIRLLLRW